MEPGFCTRAPRPHSHRRITSRKQGTQEARLVPQRLRCVEACTLTHWKESSCGPGYKEGELSWRRRPQARGRAHRRPGREGGGVNLRMQVLRFSLCSLAQTSSRIFRPLTTLLTWHNPLSPAGQTSPTPIENPLRSDPDINFERLARCSRAPASSGSRPGHSVVAVETALRLALGRMNSFSGQREAYSLELSVTARTPVATVCPTSPERSLSPGKVAEPPGKNLWEQICEGRQAGRAERGGTLAAQRRPRNWTPSLRQLTVAPQTRGAPHFTPGKQARRALPESPSTASNVHP